jgi:hypothetical protein
MNNFLKFSWPSRARVLLLAACASIYIMTGAAVFADNYNPNAAAHAHANAVANANCNSAIVVGCGAASAVQPAQALGEPSVLPIFLSLFILVAVLRAAQAG